MKMATVNNSDPHVDGTPGFAVRTVRRALAALSVLALLGWSPQASALDSYTIDHNFSRPDFRDRYALRVLRAALQASSDRYGSYELNISTLAMERDRLMLEMVKGNLVNLSAQLTSAEWEQQLIPIRVPFDKGVSGYRISLIDGRRQAQFSALTGLPELMALPLGAGRQWSSTAVLRRAGFDVVSGNSTAGLHGMLAAKRFAHFPRGIEEAVFEQEAYVAAFPTLAIETSMMIYMPMPRYFFVAPDSQRLAERLEYGLRLLVADGRFDQMFHESYDGLIEKVGLRKRRIFKLDNPFLSSRTPLSNKAYWYDPLHAPRPRAVPVPQALQ